METKDIKNLCDSINILGHAMSLDSIAVKDIKKLDKIMSDLINIINFDIHHFKNQYPNYFDKKKKGG